MPRIVKTVYAPFRFVPASLEDDRLYTPRTPLTGIAIASDSEVDTVDIFPRRTISYANRIRVSVWRPYQGIIDAGTDLLIRPVRRLVSPVGLSGDIDDDETGIAANIASHPLLSLEWHYEGYPQPAPRAPGFYYVNTDQDGAAQFWFPVMGRERISIAIKMPTLTGGPPTFKLFGVDCNYASDEIGTESGSEIATIAFTAANDEIQYDLSVAPYDYLVFEQDKAGTYTVNVSIVAYDGQAL